MDSKFATPEATMARLPAWVAYDRKVLRFSGYFKEAVHASAVENWRVRKCLVYFYLEDDSMHIVSTHKIAGTHSTPSTTRSHHIAHTIHATTIASIMLMYASLSFLFVL